MILYIIPLAAIIAAVFIFNKVLKESVSTDFKKWLLTQEGIPTPVDHTSGWKNRANKIWPVPVLLTISEILFAGLSWWAAVAFIAANGIVMFSFWTLFDGFFNIKRRAYAMIAWPGSTYYKAFTFWYQGSSDPSHPDAWVDSIKNSKTKKIAGVLVSVGVYIFSLLW